jgi:hypothetical protein
MDTEKQLDPISEFVGTETGFEHSIIPVKNNTPIIHSDQVAENAKSDYEQARESMKHTIDIGTNILENLAKVAEESESPRAYEVLANTLKTITDMNKSLMDLHRDAQDIMNQKPKDSPETVNNTQFIFNGSTEELQKLLMEKK